MDRRDILARIVRAQDAIEDGDSGFAWEILRDLELDLLDASDERDVAA
jgi:hypothetical protein